MTPISRRELLKMSGLVTATRSAFAQSSTSPPHSGERRLAYVASYSSPQGPEGSKGYGRGIYLFEMNPSNGMLSLRDVFPNDSNPSWLALSPSRSHLYSANETAVYKGAQSGSVSAYAVDRATGRVSLLNTENSHGAGPCYVSVHPSGRYALVANYYGGTVAVLPIMSGGKLGPAADVKAVTGRTGPAHAASAPKGSFAISGHDRSHAHMILPDPSGRFVLSTNLGLDEILIWKFDVETGKLTPNDPPLIALPPGDGPRHFTFHPNGRWLYCLQEEASTLVAFEYDGSRGRLKSMQTVSTLPGGFAGTSFTSEVMISPDARFVYTANRLHDSIAWFSIGSRGALILLGEEWTRGDYPRSFNIDPSGSFLYSCNQRGDAVACFRVNRDTGALTFTGQYTPVGTPAMILFMS